MRVTDLAVIGGGQLARMMQPPAIALGLRLRLLAEGPDVSAAQVIGDHLVGDYRDLPTLREAVADAPVVTFDHEHVPPEHLRALAAEGHACHPGPHALLFAQDKIEMRRRLTAEGVPCPRWAEVREPADIAAFGADVGFPIVLKTARGGYDGKGVWFLDAGDPLPQTPDVALLLEEKVDFVRELSVLVARRPSGDTVTYPVAESRQVGGVCKEVVVPAPDLSAALAAEAQAIAERIAGALDVTGILAVEMYQTTDGRVLVNELAMRPHNTGHWSIDGATTSQFENHLRAVLDRPLGSPEPTAPVAVMVNVLGGSVTDLVAASARVMADDPAVKVHLYGKDVKPGRKVGHVNVVGDDLDDVLARARRAADLLTDG